MRAGVQREAAPPLLIGRGRRGRHYPRLLLGQQRLEAAEVGGGEADVRSRIAQHSLDWPEEAAEVVDLGMVEEPRADRQQRAVDAQLLPIVTLAQGGEQAGRLARAQGYPEAVAGLETAGRRFDAERLGHGPTLPGCARG